MLNGFKRFQSLKKSYQGMDDLAYEMSRLHLQGSPLIFSRDFRTSALREDDRDHLDSQGRIRQEIIDKRLAFLREHGFLKDSVIFRDKIVYANFHLLEALLQNKKNQKRIKKGLAPLDEKGEPLNLHHLFQTHESPLVVLPGYFHTAHHDFLHSMVSLEEGVNRNRFARERKQFWKLFANDEFEPAPTIKKNTHRLT